MKRILIITFCFLMMVGWLAGCSLTAINEPESGVDDQAQTTSVTPEIAVTPIALTVTDTHEPKKVVTAFFVCGCKALNIRSGPSSDSTIIGWLDGGSPVTVTSKRNGVWAEIKPAGWVHQSYLCPAE